MNINNPLNILVVEDNAGDFLLVQEYLKEVIPHSFITQNKLLEEACKSLAEQRFDVILLDLTLPDSNWEDSIKNIISLSSGAAVIVLTGLGDKQIGIDSLKSGVQDYLVKYEVNPSALYKSISYSIDRKKGEEQIRLSEEKYRYLFNNNPESIFIWDVVTLKIIDVNETAVKQYGYSKSELLQMSFADLFAKMNKPVNLPELTLQMISGQKIISSTLWKQHKKNGRLIDIDFSLHQINYNDTIAIMAMGNDVTEKLLLQKKLEEEKLRKEQELKEAVITAQEQERTELCNELHDNINQLLATSRLYLECAITEEGLRLKLINDSKNYILSAINEIRRLSKTLLPPSLGETGLLEALDDLINSQRQVSKINFTSNWNNFDENKSSDKLKLAVFRIVQEQLNNTIRHADASNIDISLLEQDGQLQLQIKDDGIGFDKTKKRDGVGIQNITTRAIMHKGTMSLESAPGQGCSLLLKFPL